MVVRLNDLNQAVERVTSQLQGSVAGLEKKLPSLRNAVRTSNFTNAGEVLAGIESLTNNMSLDALSAPEFSQPIVRLTESIPGLQNELLSNSVVSAHQAALNALEGNIDGAGTAAGTLLHEVITLGTNSAIHNVLSELTGKTPQQLEGIMKKIAPPEFANDILDGLEQFDEVAQVASGFVPQLGPIIQQVQSALPNLVPAISGFIVDDILRDIDPAIQTRLQSILSVNRIPAVLKKDILKNLYYKNFDAAAQLVRNYPTGLTDLTEILDELVQINLDPNSILGNVTNALSITAADRGFAGSRTPETFRFEYVDTAEEFEAIIASSTRNISTFVLHSTGTPNLQNLTSEDLQRNHSAAGFDGNQYHFIIDRNGRVQRGRPLSSPGGAVSGASASELVSIAFVGTDMNIPQKTSYIEIQKAAYRVIPGLQTVNVEQFANRGERSVNTNNSRPSVGFTPAMVNSCLFNRGGDGGFYSPGEGIVPRDPAFGQPGLASNLQPDLLAILEYCAANTDGVTGLQTTSGIRRGEVGSGRHYEGWASDVMLLGENNRALHVADANHPEDLAVIQEFTRNFITYARSQGFQPSVGWGNPSIPNRRLYMGGNVGHFDIAAGRATIRPVYAAIWGQSSPGGPPPQWLTAMF